MKQVVLARKERTCTLCPETIQIGDPYERVVIKPWDPIDADGDTAEEWRTWRYCWRCVVTEYEGDRAALIGCVPYVEKTGSMVVIRFRKEIG